MHKVTWKETSHSEQRPVTSLTPLTDSVSRLTSKTNSTSDQLSALFFAFIIAFLTLIFFSFGVKEFHTLRIWLRVSLHFNSFFDSLSEEGNSVTILVYSILWFFQKGNRAPVQEVHIELRLSTQVSFHSLYGRFSRK